jgi:hypothetical protein
MSVPKGCEKILLEKHSILVKIKKVRVMVFNATFNNISVISWQSAFLVEETRLPIENHPLATSH